MSIGDRSRIVEDHAMNEMRKKVRTNKMPENVKMKKELKEVVDKLELVIPEKRETNE